MQKFFENFSFILAFLVFLLAWNWIFGAKPTEYLLLLILLGMALVNADLFTSLFKNLEGTKTAPAVGGGGKSGGAGATRTF